MLWGFALEYYGGQVAIPGQVVVPRSFEDADLLETFLGERRGATVEVRSAQRGEKRRLADLAARNAELALEHDSLMRERTRARRIEALEELREALNLEVLPLRIECFDISNLGESNPVASMSVFEDAVAKQSDYRKFAIRHSAGQDDFAMIAEAVGRRFARMTSVEADDYDRSFATAPNLVVIDGGKGQLGAALEAMAEFDLPRVAVISLAKRTRRSSCRAAPSRSCSTAPRPGCSCCSGCATRPTGSRSGSTASGGRRRASTRSSTACPASARPGGGC